MTKKLISVFLKISTFILVSVLLIALFFNFSTMLSVGKIKRGESVTSGYACAIINSGSMEPSISVNDLLIIKALDSYEKKDVVSYISKKGSMITHRVAEVSDNGYITQGDANNVSDSEISAQRLIGKVIFIVPGVGGIVNFLISPISVILLICIFLLVLAIKKLTGWLA